MRRGPRAHFSFRSPYSWMAIERLRQRIPDALARIELIPYWDPDAQTERALRERGAEFHYAQMGKAKHLYILHDTRRQAARLGLRMRWPVDDEPWWERPHLAWLAARGCGRGEEFYSAVVAARWERGEDICDPAVIRDLADRTGLNADRLLAAAHSPRVRAEAVDCLELAYEDDIFGVPYFRIGRHRFWGLDRVDTFVDELSAAGARTEAPGSDGPPAAARARVGGYDTDTAGGCG